MKQAYEDEKPELVAKPLKNGKFRNYILDAAYDTYRSEKFIQKQLKQEVKHWQGKEDHSRQEIQKLRADILCLEKERECFLRVIKRVTGENENIFKENLLLEDRFNELQVKRNDQKEEVAEEYRRYKEQMKRSYTDNEALKEENTKLRSLVKALTMENEELRADLSASQKQIEDLIS